QTQDGRDVEATLTAANKANAVAPIFEISDVEVRYESFTLGPIRLSFRGAQIVSLLGPNGSGKTTLIRSVLGLQPAAGHSELNETSLVGRPPALLAAIGYLTDSADDMIPELTPNEYWEFCALAYTRFGGSVDQMLSNAKQLSARLGFAVPNRS